MFLWWVNLNFSILSSTPKRERSNLRRYLYLWLPFSTSEVVAMAAREKWMNWKVSNEADSEGCQCRNGVNLFFFIRGKRRSKAKVITTLRKRVLGQGIAEKGCTLRGRRHPSQSPRGQICCVKTSCWVFSENTGKPLRVGTPSFHLLRGVPAAH